VKDFIFFAAIYGLSVSLAVLPVGKPWRATGILFDRLVFPNRWLSFLPENERGGLIRIFVHCPACVSFWAGALSSAFIYSPARLYLHVDPIVAMAIDGLASTGIIWAIHVTLTKLGQYDL